MVQNKGLIFKKIPDGWPKEGEHLTLETRDIDLDKDVQDGGVIVKNLCISFDPYQRGRMRAPEKKSYSPPYGLNKPITNRGIGKVVTSKSDKWKVGDVLIVDGTGTEEYTSVPQQAADGARKLENPHGLDPAIFVGALGMPGLTAYSSLYEIGKPKKGETIFVSAASGAVGALVGQLAKREGLKVVGSVGNDEKLAYIKNELGFDDGFNYKKEKPLEALQRIAPDGIDIYYENVGGEQLEAAINHLKQFGRIVTCGMISQYNVKPEDAYPIRNLMQVVAKRLKIQGFIVGDPEFGPKHFKDHQENVSKWIADGSLKAKMSVVDGIDKAADGFIGMLAGKNFGKTVLQIAPFED